MKIAILGWGSLLWDNNHPDFDQRHEPWKYEGPRVKLEFSRISAIRQGALTLVIDHICGTSTDVAWCLSNRDAPDDTICDLRCREGTTLKNIARVNVTNQKESTDLMEAHGTIVSWAREKGLEIVVWTALKNNFKEKTGDSFSVETAMSYLRALPPKNKIIAVEYISRAPDFVQTPLRAAIEREPWFQENLPLI